ncbi:cysteinyl leukotriene receptor 2 [Alligator sinensis]|uniref:Cysteinyl Leukotriene receptor 2 n=1 Tax=Alligator sinensis TaxID=38654 RepID=A0A1U7S6W6_ALLSI|nr:cysteinyl leukotriene receptor 2 [Alligator sinensis]XP_006030242.1 cysteinyl leukotriene receptor 2 [Alligator sinensis]XP_025067533.1 cysteinyl leukotriene receptor 2 [Alligator sinensis]
MNGTNNTSGNCMMDKFKQVVYPTAYLTIFIFGVVGNGLSIYVFLQPCKRKTSGNIFMLNLAISDLMFVSTLPFRAAYYLMKSDWIFQDVFCRIVSYILYVNMYCSIYFLTTLSVARFMVIVYPFKCFQVTSTKYARIICVVIWIFVMASSSQLLGTGTTVTNSSTQCLDLQPNNIDKIFLLNNIVLVVGFSLPFCTIVVCYVFVIKALLKSKTPNTKVRASHKKAKLTIILTLFIFFLCFLPYHILRTVHLVQTKNGIESKCNLHKGVIITLCLAAMNSCLDPVLFYFVGENFKARLKNICKR